MEFDQTWLDSINERLKPLVRRLADATLPICQPRKRPRMASGSGVFLHIDDRRYVLTASHVFAHADRELPIAAIVGDRFVVLRSCWRTKATSSDSADPADLAIAAIELPDGLPRPGATPIGLADLDPFASAIELEPHTSFLALGYPRTKQPKILKSGEYGAFAYHFLTHREEFAPNKSLAGDPDLHLAVGYDPRDFIGTPGVSEMPDPDCMSGGGLWRIPRAITTDAPEAHLVGILIRHHSREQQIIASRVRPLLHFLAQLHPDNAVAIQAHFPGINPQATN